MYLKRAQLRSISLSIANMSSHAALYLVELYEGTYLSIMNNPSLVFNKCSNLSLDSIKPSSPSVKGLQD